MSCTFEDDVSTDLETSFFMGDWIVIQSRAIQSPIDFDKMYTVTDVFHDHMIVNVKFTSPEDKLFFIMSLCG